MNRLVKNDSFKSYINLSMTEKTPEDVLEEYSNNKKLSSTNNNNAADDHSKTGTEEGGVETADTFVSGHPFRVNSEKIKKVTSESEASNNECNRLCGYLKKLKLGYRNVGREFKTRWFVLAEESCTLLYFATAKDLAPLGEINISKSVFTFLTDEEQSLTNVFQIRSPDKTVLLQAEDSQTMLYWIQSLQFARKKYFMKLKTQKLQNFNLVSTSQESDVTCGSHFSFICEIERPSHTVGESSAKHLKPATRSKSLRDLSFANWKFELQNKFSTIKTNINVNKNHAIVDANVKNSNINNNESDQFADNKISHQNYLNQNVFSRLKSCKPMWNRSVKLNRNQNSNDVISEIGKNESETAFNSSFSGKCSNCVKMKCVVEEMKKNEVTMLQEMSAHDIITSNLHKVINELKQQLRAGSIAAVVEDADDDDGEAGESEGASKKELQKFSRNVDLEELIVQLHASLVAKDCTIDELKKKLEKHVVEIESLRFNLNMKDEMLMFLTNATHSNDNTNNCYIMNSNNTTNVNQKPATNISFQRTDGKMLQHIAEQPLNSSTSQQQHQQQQHHQQHQQQQFQRRQQQTLYNSSDVHKNFSSQAADNIPEPTNGNSEHIVDEQQANVTKQLCTILKSNKIDEMSTGISLYPPTTITSSSRTTSFSPTTTQIISSLPPSTTTRSQTASIPSSSTTLPPTPAPSTASSCASTVFHENLMLFEEHLTDLGSGNNIGIASNININNAKASIPDTSGASNISDSYHMKKADIITNSLFAKNISNSSKSGEPWVLCDDASWKYYQEESLAYKAQNKMLNQEIIELNDLVCSLETKLDESQICVTKLEASLNHMNNKFWKCYFDLNELCTNEVAIVTSDKLKQIFEDSLQTDDSDGMFDRMRSKQGPVYDQYGFEKTLKREATFTQANDGLENNEQQSAMKSEMIKMKQKSQLDMNLCLKWETMLISLERCLTFKNKETKMMIRDGVPSQFRARLWKVCIDVLIKEYRANASVNSYSGILDMVVNKKVVTPFANQIELDLLRTLPNNKHFSTFTSSKIISLRNILLAFSIHNPDIGYCQGLNRIGGILLLVLSEEEAFWGLVAMVEVAMPTNYYNRTLMAAHADQRVLKDILADKLPTLSQHFSSLNFEPSLFTFSWFLTIFVDNLPVSTFLRIWDTFLYEGSKVLFRYALAIMKFYECKILSFQTATELNMFIRSMCENLTDVNRLSQIAFNELNPFPMRAIKNKRVQHLSKLKMELVELEKLRQTFQENLRTASDEEDKQEDADSI